MSEVESITRMATGIASSFAEENWPKALRYAERIKGMLLEATIRDDTETLRAAAQALHDSEQRLRIRYGSDSKLDATATMWQLRADSTMASLAARIRPSSPPRSSSERAANVPDLLLRILEKSNRPMTNSELAARSGKDPAVIARSLKALERQQKIKSWRVGSSRMNVAKNTSPLSNEKSLNDANGILQNIRTKGREKPRYHNKLRRHTSSTISARKADFSLPKDTNFALNDRP